MGQSQPKLKITNNAQSVVIIHITDFEKKPIQQAIAPNATFTLETSRGYHTISVYPLGTTSVHGIRPIAHYDFYPDFGDNPININPRGRFLNISRPIEKFHKMNTPDSICNKTDKTILVVVTDKNGKFFEQFLLKDDSYQFYSQEGQMNISVFRPGKEDYITTYSFIGKRRTSGSNFFIAHHWEASITKVKGLVNIGVVHENDYSAGGGVGMG